MIERQPPMRDDDQPPAPQDQTKVLRQNFDEFVDFIAREMIEMVMKSDPFLSAYKSAGTALNQSVNLDGIVYVICHRLLVNGIGFNNLLMQRIADKLTIGTLANLL